MQSLLMREILYIQYKSDIVEVCARFSGLFVHDAAIVVINSEQRV